MYFPVVVAVYVCDPAPEIITPFLYQRYVPPSKDEDVNVTDPPTQNIVDVAGVIVGLSGNGFTITTVGLLEPLTHDPVVTITV